MFVPVLLGGHTLCDPHHLGCPSVETRIITCVDQQGKVCSYRIYVPTVYMYMDVIMH